MLVKLCECGCGQPAPISKVTSAQHGYVKGEAKRFIHNHHMRVKYAPIGERLKNFKVDPKTKCHLWLGDKNKYGYPRIAFEGKQWTGTRLLWILKVGDPGNLLVCHRCDTPSCMNLKHLFLGTNQDNSTDMVKKGRHRSTKGYSKYPKELLLAAKKAWLSGTKTKAQVAAEYGISVTKLTVFIKE